MIVNDEKVRVYKTKFGNVVGEEVYTDGANGQVVKLKFPFHFHPGTTPSGQSGFNIVPIVHDDDWCILNVSDAIEVNASQGILDLYKEYVTKIHSVIIQPNKGLIL